MKKRISALILSAILVLGMTPVSVWAAEETPVDSVQEQTIEETEACTDSGEDTAPESVAADEYVSAGEFSADTVSTETMIPEDNSLEDDSSDDNSFEEDSFEGQSLNTPESAEGNVVSEEYPEKDGQESSVEEIPEEPAEEQFEFIVTEELADSFCVPETRTKTRRLLTAGSGFDGCYGNQLSGDSKALYDALVSYYVDGRGTGDCPFTLSEAVTLILKLWTALLSTLRNIQMRKPD